MERIGWIGTVVALMTCWWWVGMTAFSGIRFAAYTREATWVELAVQGVLGLSALWILAFALWMVYVAAKDRY